jgi:hypothetical protein
MVGSIELIDKALLSMVGSIELIDKALLSMVGSIGGLFLLVKG